MPAFVGILYGVYFRKSSFKYIAMARQKTKHHLIPKSRRRNYKNKKVLDIQKVLVLWNEKHQALHTLFGNMTLDEIILTLQRIRRIKFGEELDENTDPFY